MDFEHQCPSWDFSTTSALIISYIWIQINFFSPNFFPFQLCAYFWLHLHNLGFDVSIEFFFPRFLSMFSWNFFICYLKLLLFHIVPFQCWSFSCVVKVYSFKLLCNFLALIFQLVLEFFFKFKWLNNVVALHFLKGQILLFWVLM